MKLSIFFCDGVTFAGIDVVNNEEYKITFCGNGSYSHYILENIKNAKDSKYVYCDEKDPHYRLIYHAERILVYKTKPCCFCHEAYVGQDQVSCSRCWNSAWLKNCLTRKLFT